MTEMYELKPAGVTEEQVEAALKARSAKFPYTIDTILGESGVIHPSQRDAVMRAALEAAAKAHPSLPAGHVAVPVEATEAMVEAFMAEMKAQGVALDDFSEPIYPAKLYRAMLAALPHNQGEGK